SGGELIEFSTPDETIAAVKSGEADAVLADGDYLMPIVEESGGMLEVVGEPVFIGGGVGMGIRESDGDLKAAMNAAIEQMKSDGSLNALITKWFDASSAVY
ncbi:MAG: transporter substrate-binding domain-containing protein, partial [Alphaproteobacteria bacterium]